MNCYQDSCSGSTLAAKPSSSFSSTSSTLAGTKLLFGEIDGFSDHSSYHSLCSIVLSYNPSFARVWNTDVCRTNLLSFLPRGDLIRLRLVCHDFSKRLAPAVFEGLDITFRLRTFSSPAKLAALDRVGHLVKTLTFTMVQTRDTQLPPLIDVWTGEEKDFMSPPQATLPSPQGKARTVQARYGDWETTDLLTKQYPPLFHAATNLDAFVRAFSCFTSLSSLVISCPALGTDPTRCNRRTIVDFALISLRNAVERAGLVSFEALSLLNMHPRGLLYLSPLLGPGANPASSRRWSQIKRLTMQVYCPEARVEFEELNTLHAYIRTFNRLVSFDFQWLGNKGPSPLLSHSQLLTKKKRQAQPTPRTDSSRHPAHRMVTPQGSTPRKVSSKSTVLSPFLTHLSIENATMSATHVRSMISNHIHTLEDLTLESICITEGTWDDALEPLRDMSRKGKPKHDDVKEEIPIMLAPSLIAEKRKKTVRIHSSVPLQGVSSSSAEAAGKGSIYPQRREARKPESRFASDNLLRDSDAAEGVRTLLSGSKEVKKPKWRKRDFWGCQGVLKAVRGGLVGWR